MECPFQYIWYLYEIHRNIDNNSKNNINRKYKKDHITYSIHTLSYKHVNFIHIGSCTYNIYMSILWLITCIYIILQAFFKQYLTHYSLKIVSYICIDFGEGHSTIYDIDSVISLQYICLWYIAIYRKYVSIDKWICELFLWIELRMILANDNYLEELELDHVYFNIYQVIPIHLYQ